MYGDVWEWAGEFRRSNKNLGVDKLQVAIELRKLLGDCRFWIENNTPHLMKRPFVSSIALYKFIVSRNGNGRHSRLMGDLIIEKIFFRPVFTWGSRGDLATGQERAHYLSAIKAADANNISDLLAFARK